MNGSISEDIYANIDAQLQPQSLMIFNNTKVVEARLLFKKPTGAQIEIFCLEPDERYTSLQEAMMQAGTVYWKCLVGGANKWKNKSHLEKRVNAETDLTLTASIHNILFDCFVIKFEWNDMNTTFAEVLHAAGSIPLPPYLNRTVEEDDKLRYQTVYAKNNGSVAAPTAGLHFTKNIFTKLEAKEIKHDFVTLHVGAGTFKPVKAETLVDHEMHAEFFEVSNDNIRQLLKHLDTGIVAVGTTSLRTIESLYWMGLKLKNDPTLSLLDLRISQWEPYDVTETISAKDALDAILNWMQVYNADRIISKTQILIAPGYSLKIATGIVTNFHQPQSTLLLLIASIIGDDWKLVYDYAMQNNFRFLSYGDGCLLWPNMKAVKQSSEFQ